MSQSVFVPEQFVGHPWYVGRGYDSPDRDARFCNQFARFLASGCAWSAFPKWFYQELSNTFGHIAHYNQHGFYATWCETTAQRVAFLEHTLTAQRICVMAREEVILAWLPTTTYLNDWCAQLAAETRVRDLAELARLAQLYGVTITGILAEPATGAPSDSVAAAADTPLLLDEGGSVANTGSARRTTARAHRVSALSAWANDSLWADDGACREGRESEEAVQGALYLPGEATHLVEQSKQHA